MDAEADTIPFDPPVFRYTVRTPESRQAAIKAAAKRAGMTPGQLVQTLFDRLDLSLPAGEIAKAVEEFKKLFRAPESSRELAERAAKVGMTARELKVFRALCAAAGPLLIIRPSAMDISTRSLVDPNHLDEAYDGLLAKGFLAVSPSQGRGRRCFCIVRMADI